MTPELEDIQKVQKSSRNRMLQAQAVERFSFQKRCHGSARDENETVFDCKGLIKLETRESVFLSSSLPTQCAENMSV